MGKTVAVIISAVVFSVIGLLTSIFALSPIEEMGAEATGGLDAFTIMVVKFAAPAVGAVVGLFIGCVAVIVARIGRGS